MNDDWVPIQFPDNFDEMLEAFANYSEERIGWCLLCNSPIRTEADLMPPFARIDRDVFAVWDASDSSTDIYLVAAISVGKAILFRQKIVENKTQGDILAIERAVNILEKQLQGLDEVESWTNTIQSSGSKIIKRIISIRKGAQDQIEQLRDRLGVLTSEQ